MYKGYIRVIEEMTLLRYYYIEMDLHKEFSRPFFKHLRPSRGLKRAPRDNVQWENSVVISFDKLCVYKKKSTCVLDNSGLIVCSCVRNFMFNECVLEPLWGHECLRNSYRNFAQISK